MKKQLLFVLVLVLATVSAWAVPAKRVPVKCTQSDGSVLTLYLQGDEFFHYYTTLDGTPMLPDPSGMYKPCTQEQIASLRLQHTNEAYAAAPGLRGAQKVGSSKNPTGNQRVLVILAQFSDLKFAEENPQEAFDKHLNAENYTATGGYGSARDYFIAQSDGLFTPQFDVYGPYTASHAMAYYGGNDEDGGDKAAGELVAEAVKLGDKDIDYSLYDTDGNGSVDFCYVIYAGYAEAHGASANTIWPHQWYISAATGSALKLDGTQINAYACSSELSGSSGTQLDGIGTLCHEFSHCLGLPDFYDTTDEGRFGMFTWSLMDYGCYNNGGFTPAAYTAYEKEFLGWMDIETLDNECQVTLQPTAEGGKAYRIESSENTDEYYIVENIQQKGWNSAACGHGMLVTHVDYAGSAWNSNIVNSTDRQRMTIVAADNKWTRSFTSAAGDLYPGSTDNHELSDSSTPAALTNDGNSFYKPITDIQESEDGTITFNFMKGCGNATTANAATAVTATSFVAHWAKRLGTDDYTLEVFHITGELPAEESSWNAALLNQQGELIGMYHSNKMEMEITNLEAENLYCYRVRCLKDGSLSSFSNLIFVCTTADDGALTAPTLNAIETLSDSTFILSWTAVEGASSYVVEYEQTATEGDNATGDGEVMVEENFNTIETKQGEITRVLDLYTQSPDWRGSEIYAESERVRLGKAGEAGYLLTPYLPHYSDYVTIEFTVSKYSESDAKPILHICLATDADLQYYTDQVGAYITSTDNTNYYCVLGPLDTSSYIAFISNCVQDSGDNPIICLDNVKVSWGDLSELYGAPAAAPARFTTNIDEALRLPQRENAPAKVATSTKKYLDVEDTSHLFDNLEEGTYNFRVRAVKGSTRSPYSASSEYEVGNTTFEVNGLNFDIVSEEHMSVAVTPLRDGRLYEGDIVIPSSIEYEGETYTITELADSVFRGCASLHSVSIPSTVTFAGSKIFKGCKKLTWVDWQGTAAIDATDFIGTAYNTLVYVGSDVIVDSEDVIVIRDGVADSITLSLNGSFLVPRTFQARHIEYRKDFSQSTFIGTTAGWETIVLPYDVQKVESEDKGVLTPFGVTGSDHHYWIGKYNGSTFDYASEAPQANVPYVISFPNSTDYDEEERINGTIIFSADNATVQATTEVPRVSGTTYDFVPIYEKVYKAADRYMLNTYDNACSTPAGSAFIADRMSLRALGAYMESKGRSSAPQFAIRFETPIADELPVTDAADVYSIDGRLVRTAAEAQRQGQTAGLQPGIYVIEGTKYIVR